MLVKYCDVLQGVTAFAMGHQQEQEFQDYGVISELLEVMVLFQ